MGLAAPFTRPRDKGANSLSSLMAREAPATWFVAGLTLMAS